MKAVLTGVCFVAAVSVSASAAAQRTIDMLGSPSKKLTQKDITALSGCKLVFKLKAGMTNSEAADAIDAGFAKVQSCLKAAARKAESK